MSPKEYKGQKKIWDTAAAFGKVILKIADGNSGLVFIEKDGGIAAIVLGESLAGKEMIKTFKTMRSRLDDMIRHAEDGTLDQGKGTSAAFIRDSATGNYEKVDSDEPKCPLCGGTGTIGVGKKCICQF